MNENLKTALWQQFGAAIDTLDDALKLCPDRLWETVLWEDEEDARYGQFWYIAYHTLVCTDLFLSALSVSYEDFRPPAPFIWGKLPDEPYHKDQLHRYLTQCYEKCKAMVEALTDEQAAQICKFSRIELSYLELQMYSMRHVQEHAAQLNMILGHRGITGQDWVPRARISLQ